MTRYAEIDWERRYPKNWNAISLNCKQSTDFICCNCWENRAKHSHHTRYRFLFLRPRKWAIGIFLFPLCEPCHKIAHRRLNYIKSERPLWGNKNTLRYSWTLRLKWNVLRIFLKIRGKSYE